jgi:glycosyltransferase involved in cell wall biosynthesis
VSLRLAFFSPLPPASTGIADYTIDVAGELRARCAIDVFHDQETVETGRLPPGVGAFPAASFDARHAERPYDLNVYQMGNGTAHAFLYPFLLRLPGLLVLHDLVLHHSRAKTFLDSAEARAYAADPASITRRDAALTRIDEYRAEVEYSYPGRGERVAFAQLGTVGPLLPYAYPLFRIPVEASRLTACHNAFMVEAVRDEVAGSDPVHVPMMAAAAHPEAGEVRALRTRLGIAEGDLVIGSFGLLTPEKRVETVARAVARATVAHPRLRLLLVGPVPDRESLDRQLARLGVLARTVVTGRVPFHELPAHIELADIVVHLRYPTARETSAALLRVLAQGRPTVISDLEHLADIPEDAVARAAPDDEEGDVLRAILRLADDRGRRERLGQRAAAFVADAHSPFRCRDGYRAAIDEALHRDPPVPRAWPPHSR